MTQTVSMRNGKALPGSGRLSVKVVAGQSAAVEVSCSNPLKLLTPRPRGPSVWAYMSSFGGGLVPGDQTRVQVHLGPGARCFLTTQASTKIYRNPRRRPCSHDLSVQVDENALLVLAPDPVQSFADSAYVQSQQFHLHQNAGLVLMDWFCSGRVARGERWNFHSLRSRNDVFMDGAQCLVDSLVLDGAQGPLSAAHRLGRFNCVGLILIVGGSLQSEGQTLLERIKKSPVHRKSNLIFAGSPIRGGTVLRIAGERFEDVAHYVYRSLGFVAALLQDDPWIRKLSCLAGAN